MWNKVLGIAQLITFLATAIYVVVNSNAGIAEFKSSVVRLEGTIIKVDTNEIEDRNRIIKLETLQGK